MTTVRPAAAAAKDFLPDPTTLPPPPSLRTLLALDLGKFKSVACVFDVATAERRFVTIDSTPAAVHDLLIDLSPDRLVIEACSISGWVCDVARALNVAVQTNSKGSGVV